MLLSSFTKLETWNGSTTFKLGKLLYPRIWLFQLENDKCLVWNVETSKLRTIILSYPKSEIYFWSFEANTKQLFPSNDHDRSEHERFLIATRLIDHWPTGFPLQDTTLQPSLWSFTWRHSSIRKRNATNTKNDDQPRQGNHETFHQRPDLHKTQLTAAAYRPIIIETPLGEIDRWVTNSVNNKENGNFIKRSSDNGHQTAGGACPCSLLLCSKCTQQPVFLQPSSSVGLTTACRPLFSSRRRRRHHQTTVWPHTWNHNVSTSKC